MTAGLDLLLLHLTMLSPSAFPLFDLLVSSELLAALILPLPFVLVAACWNSVFTLVALAVLPETPFLMTVMAASATQLFLWSVVLYGLVASGLWLLVGAIERRDLAEEIARLQQTCQRERMAQERLQDALGRIGEIPPLVLAGDLAVRAAVPAEEGTPLWSLAVSLNTLLERMQHLSQVEVSHQALLPLLSEQERLGNREIMLRQDIAYATQAVRFASHQQRPIQLEAPRVEALRPLFEALQQNYVVHLESW